jgi:hypothetical protein
VNLNRNYPSGWNPERLQYGASLYPTSEPEIRAIVDFVLAHPNIAGAVSYHTHAGAILRPFATRPDAEFPPGDLELYEALGAMGTEETGYPVASTYGDFTPRNVPPRGGTMMGWAYEELGIPTFTVELWNLFKEAGFEDVPLYNIDVTLPKDTMAKVLSWAEQHTTDAFLPWRPFDHPQLGPVEIGGWNRVFIFRNPPGSLVEGLAAANARFTFRHAATLPRIEIECVETARQDGDVYAVRAVVANAGYLPTYLTQMALDNDATEPVIAELQGRGIEILDGLPEREVGHLSGRSERRAPYAFWGDPWGTPRRLVTWFVRGPSGAAASVRAGCPRAGYDTQEFFLE